MRQIILLVSFCLCVCVLRAQVSDPYSKDWKRADSMLQNGFPESAAQIAQSVYDRARQYGQPIAMMKAELLLLSANFHRSEDAFREAIQKAEEYAVSSAFPQKAIWQSLVAELYWQYYLQNRWEIMNRTRIDPSVSIDDFEQWDAARFFDKSAQFYQASLSRAAELERIKLESYEPILIKGKNTRHLRPSLFDLLAFRALEYYEHDEKELGRPANSFIVNDTEAFATAEVFSRYRFPTKDTASLQWQALSLYQRILELHLDDSSKDALIDADLHRLRFVYSKSVHPQKDSLYRRALEEIEQHYSVNPLSALASLQIAQLMLGKQSNQTGYYVRQPEQKIHIDYPVIIKRLEQIVAKHPKSEAAVTALSLLDQIKAKSLNVVTEQVVLPGEPSRVLVHYKNVPKVYIRVVRLDNGRGQWVGAYSGHIEDRNQELLALPHLKQWMIALPASDDYQEHTTEVVVEALPTGTYAIVLSAVEGFPTQENIISFAPFQVSRLSAVQAGGAGYVLDRKTGQPRADATVDFFRQRYDERLRRYELVKTSNSSTDRTGRFVFPQRNEVANGIRIRTGEDTVMLAGYFSNGREREGQKSETKTFFFTDRAIYRPGQTIHFKGLILRQEEGGRRNQVVTNEKTEVTLYDVNSQKVASLTLTTNEFGSFSGSFTAPEGLLTGNMILRNSTGYVSISVEEYKRPRFAVTFDTLKKAYALSEKVILQGKALAYAGNAIDNATVRYRVVRNTRFPYWWYSYRWGYPPSSAMEIANGTAVTDGQGNFQVQFEAISDPSVNPASMPVFSYTVTADVTDQSGETRSGNVQISVGYSAIQLAIDVPERATPAELDTVRIDTRNLNGQFVETAVTLKISKLQEPDQVLRKRLWAAPDQYLMDSATFKKHFPFDVYRDEDNHLNWSIEKTTNEQSFISTKQGSVAVPASAWRDNGWYVLELTAKDKTGRELTEKKYVQVLNEQGKGWVNEALMVIPQTQEREPGAQVKVTVVSGYKDLHLLRQVQEVKGPGAVEQLSYKGAPVIWKKMVDEADRGGIAVSYLTVKENRVYVQQVGVNVPWSNKDLDINWETHRDKLEPGAQETWTMVVRGNKKDKVAAEMVATMYDASLDAFRLHGWRIYGLFPTLWMRWSMSGLGFEMTSGHQISFYPLPEYASYPKSYDRIDFVISPYNRIVYESASSGYVQKLSTRMSKSPSGLQSTPSAAQDEIAMDSGAELELNGAPSQQSSNDVEIVPRINLEETAFFFPHLKTDAEGNVRISFTIPEALTEWKMMAFAHTKDMQYGLLEGSVKTQKELMVMPNLPRFLRQGDEITISARISNLSDNTLNGTATLELINPNTEQSVHLPFRLQQKDQSFSVARGEGTSVSWKLHVPESIYEPVMIRVLAKAGSFTDGEQTIVPVVTNRMLVTETMPLWINGDGRRSFSLDKLKHSDSSKTLVHHSLTLEYTGNPAWYAVKSLPYLMEYPYDCAEQTFNRYYAAALAAHIMDQSPKIKTIFARWKTETPASGMASPLQTNQELKSALLQETPWVLEAQNEAEQRRRLGELFDTYKLSRELDVNMQKLRDLQLPDGSFPWFKGMRPDRYITQYIVTGMGRLQKLGVRDSKGHMQEIVRRALPYLDKQVHDSYALLVKNKATLQEPHISHYEVQYLYMRSFFSDPIRSSDKTAFEYYKSQAGKYWPRFNPYMKGMIALALNTYGDSQVPKNIIQSLRETAITKEEMGMYWMQRGHSYWWYDAPIEAQALLIEAFKEVVKDQAAVDAMKVWLLKNKQTQRWETTKATADACYALLLTGTDWLSREPEVTIQLGGKTVRSVDQQQEAGSGYFKVRYGGSDIQKEMGDMSLTIAGNAGSTSWGAVYWQYFEDLDRISSAKTPLEVRKQLFIERNTDRGPELQAITAGNVLKVGDKVKVRIEILVDRDMEYVHLKDMRASGFEPVNVISSYKWQGGLGYYESTKDLSTNFFFDYLRKGKYVFEYPMFVQQSGDFSNGVATIHCMYAPEFASHSEGIRVKVDAQ